MLNTNAGVVGVIMEVMSEGLVHSLILKEISLVWRDGSKPSAMFARRLAESNTFKKIDGLYIQECAEADFEEMKFLGEPVNSWFYNCSELVESEVPEGLDFSDPIWTPTPLLTFAVGKSEQVSLIYYYSGRRASHMSAYKVVVIHGHQILQSYGDVWVS